MRSVRLLGALMVVWAGLCAGRGAWAQGREGAAAETVRAETGEGWREVGGEVRASRRAVIGSPGAGLVVQVLAEPGVPIGAGKVIAKLDDRAGRLAVSRAEAGLALARAGAEEKRAGVERARKFVERIEAALGKGGAAPGEVDEARAALAGAEATLGGAQAEVARAESDLALARKRLEDLTIRAPFAGVVASRLTEEGQWLNEGGPVAEIVSLEDLEAWLWVPEGALGRVTGKDASVPVRIPAATESGVSAADLPRGRVVGVSPVAEPGMRLYAVRVRLEGAGPGVRPGMSVTGLVSTGRTERLMSVRAAAVRRVGAGPAVLVWEGGQTSVVPVTVVAVKEDRALVLSGRLREGLEVEVGGEGDRGAAGAGAGSGKP